LLHVGEAPREGGFIHIVPLDPAYLALAGRGTFQPILFYKNQLNTPFSLSVVKWDSNTNALNQMLKRVHDKKKDVIPNQVLSLFQDLAISESRICEWQ